MSSELERRSEAEWALDDLLASDARGRASFSQVTLYIYIYIYREREIDR